MKLLRIAGLILLAAMMAGLLLPAASAGTGAGQAGVLNNFEYIEANYRFKKSSSYTAPTYSFIYNDGFLFLGNGELSPELAKVSAALACAAYTPGELYKALSAMGYACEDYLVSDGYGSKGNWDREHTLTDNDFVRYAIARKAVRLRGVNYILYIVPVQGTSGGYDWNSDFRIGSGENHEGFYTAHNEIMTDLHDTMAADGYTAATRIVLTTGHSRGAAVSNIVAGEMTSGYSGTTGLSFSDLIVPENVFSYNFACPAVSKSAAVSSTSFDNIYNLNSDDDIIPLLPLRDWGFVRYGQTYSLAGTVKADMMRRFTSITKWEYAGTPDAVSYLELLVNELIPNSAAADSAIPQAVFSAIAYMLNEGDKQGVGLCQAMGVTLSAHAFNWIMDHDTSPESLIREHFEHINDAVVLIPDYLAETEGFTKAEFTQWKASHHDGIDLIEDAVGFNILVRSDLQRAKRTAEGDLLLWDAGSLGLDINTVIKAARIGAGIYCYLTSLDGANPLDAITHGHMSETYVLWINSMYLGYYGRYGNTQAQSVSVGDGILTIAPYCFSDAAVKTVSGTENLKYIARSAFYCSSLEEIALSDIKTGKYAFSGCKKLRSAAIGGSSVLGDYAFSGSGTESDLSVAVDGSCRVGAYAFRSCGSSEHPMDIEIGANVFLGSGILNSSYVDTLSLPARVRTISGTDKPFGSYVNSSWPYWKDIPADVAELIIRYTGNGVMADDYNLYEGLSVCVRKAVFEEGVTHIGKKLFNHIGTVAGPALEQAELPSTLRSIGDYAFFGQKKLTEISLPQSLEEIGVNAFGRTSLTSVDVPSGMIKIGQSAFNGAGLEEVRLNSAEVGLSAFSGCTKLRSVTIGNNSVIGDCAFIGCGTEGRLSVTIGESCSVGVSAFWSCGSSEYPMDIEIGEGTLLGNRILEDSYVGTLSLPAEINTINSSDHPFGDSVNNRLLKPADIAVLRIRGTGSGVMSDSTSLYTGLGECVRRAVFEEGVTHIGDCIFRSESSPTLTRAELPSTLRSIGSTAFMGQSHLTAVSLPAGLEEIGSYAFKGTSVSSVSLPSSLKKIGTYAFTALGLREVRLSGTEVGAYAFSDCTRLRSITVEGDSVLDRNAFSGCGTTGKLSITVAGTSRVGNYAFCSCGSSAYPLDIEIGDDVLLGHGILNSSYIGTLSLPTAINRINSSDYPFGYYTSPFWYKPANVAELVIRGAGSGVMTDNSSLYEGLGLCVRKAVFEEGVTHIGGYLFHISSGSGRLEQADLPSTLRSVGNFAFRGQTKLTKISLPAGTEAIGGSAFKACTALADVYYGGTEAQWAQVSVASGNEPLGSAALHCNDFRPHGYVGDIESVEAEASPDMITVSWPAADGAEWYKIARQTCGKSAWTVLSSDFTGTSFEDTGVTAGTKYRYAVRAFNDHGSGNSKTSAYVTAVGMPPADLASIETEASDGRITVSWPASEGATGYRIARQTYGSGSWIVLSSAFTGTTLEDTGVTAGNRYRYAVRPLNDYGTGNVRTSAYVKAIAGTAPPADLDSIELEASDGRITVSWPASEGATGYRIARQTYGSGSWTVLSTAFTGTTLEDTGVTAGNRYRYAVRPLNDYGTGNVRTSAYVEAIAEAAPPADLATIEAAAAPGKITVTWAASDGAEWYKIARQAYGSSSWTVLSAEFTGTTFEDTSVTAGTKYRYTVRPFNEAGSGGAKTSGYVEAK